MGTPQVDATHLELLRRLVIGDPVAAASVVAGGRSDAGLLDAPTASLVRLAATAAVGGSSAAEQAAVDACRAAGADDADVAAVLARVGMSRAAPPGPI